MIDSDWDIPIRVLTEADEDGFPMTDTPVSPDADDEEEFKRQLEEEKVKGHPAHSRQVPDYEPLDTGTYPED